MRFVKLLDPYVLPENDITAVGKLQCRARELFPALAEQSHLHYWRPGDPIHAEGDRFLVGLEASYNLAALRLADVMNAEILHNPSATVDVFDIADLAEYSELSAYLPDAPSYGCPPPFVGWWRDGIHKATKYSYMAVEFILLALDSSLTAKQIAADLCPPDPQFMDD